MRALFAIVFFLSLSTIAIGAEFTCDALVIPGLPPYASPLVCLAYMGIEYWLGKTRKTKGGSALEVGLNTVKALLAALRKPKAPEAP